MALGVCSLQLFRGRVSSAAVEGVDLVSREVVDLAVLLVLLLRAPVRMMLLLRLLLLAMVVVRAVRRLRRVMLISVPCLSRVVSLRRRNSRFAALLGPPKTYTVEGRRVSSSVMFE